ncbi:MAG: signal peptidase I [Caldisericia bacterium]|nr:signal peptidase I [Caldisericia bacterium]
MSRDQIRKTIEWVVVLIVIVGLALVVRVYAIEPRQVRMSSMYPTLNDGDYILINRMAYVTDGPKRGDIVVFEPPYSGKDDYIKRVVGLPGERIEFKAGEIWINGVLLREDGDHLFTEPENGIPELNKNDKSLEGDMIADGEYFVVGDNRSHSLDSRSFGSVKKSQIQGKAFLIFLPPRHFHVIP